MTDAIKAMMEADLDAASADISATLTIDGIEISGTASPLDKRQDMDGDGLLHESDYEFAAKRSEFEGGVPQPNKVCSLDITGTAIKCAVDSVSDDEAVVSLRLTRKDDRTSTKGII
jgi:hypothetical protein